MFDAAFWEWGPIHIWKVGFPGEDLKNVYDSLPYLNSNIRNVMKTRDNEFINLKDKTVMVLGGGDTAVDCNRTALRQGAKKSILRL